MSTTRHKIIRVSQTRPANTTAYTSGDSISDSITAPSPMKLAAVVGASNGKGQITRVRLYKSDTNVTAANFRIHFFTESVPATIDNDALSILEANAAKHIGYVDITPIAFTDFAQEWAIVDMPFTCSGDGNDVFVLMEARGAYTPASAEIFTVEAVIEQR